MRFSRLVFLNSLLITGAPNSSRRDTKSERLNRRKLQLGAYILSREIVCTDAVFILYSHFSMEMRTKAAAGKTKNKADSIVRRELAAVLTNGTVVDEAFLSGDEACHCIAIKVSGCSLGDVQASSSPVVSETGSAKRGWQFLIRDLHSRRSNWSIRANSIRRRCLSYQARDSVSAIATERIGVQQGQFGWHL